MAMIFWILEMTVILAELMLNRYAYGRGGLYKHLYFRRMQFETGFLHQNNLIILIVITSLVLILSAIFLLRLWPQNSENKKKIKIHLLFIMANAIFTLMLLLLPVLREYLLIYPYLLGTLGFLAVGNVIGILILRKKGSRVPLG